MMTGQAAAKMGRNCWIWEAFLKVDLGLANGVHRRGGGKREVKDGYVFKFEQLGAMV